MTERESRISAALRGPSGEVLRLLAAQLYRNSVNPLADHASGVLIPVTRPLPPHPSKG